MVSGLGREGVTACPVIAANGKCPANGPSLMSFLMKPWLSEANGLLSSQMGRKSQNYANCLRFNG